MEPWRTDRNGSARLDPRGAFCNPWLEARALGAGYLSRRFTASYAVRSIPADPGGLPGKL
jgi:hypothetical protein